MIAPADDPEAWPEEIEAIKNIKEGKIEMVTQSAEETIAELKECCPPIEESDQLCEECLRIGGDHVPMKAVKGYSLCTDCYKILNDS